MFRFLTGATTMYNSVIDHRKKGEFWEKMVSSSFNMLNLSLSEILKQNFLAVTCEI